MQQYLFDPAGESDFPAGGQPAPPVGPHLGMARPYQLAMRDSTLAAWATGCRALGIAATGVGKTWVACLIARAVIDGAISGVVPGNDPGVLFVAPRTDLVRQGAEAAAQLLTGVHVEVEQGDNRARGVGRFVAACSGSLTERRLWAMGAKRFQAVVLDEAHLFGPGNRVLRRLLDFYGGAVRWLALTATPDAAGIGPTWGRLAFNYGIWEAVRDGYLVEPYQALEECGGVRLDGVPLDSDGEFDAETLATRMTEAGPIAAVVKAAVKWSNYANGRKAERPTIVSCCSVHHAKLCAVALNEWHKQRGTGRAVAVYSAMGDDRRKDAYRAFEAGEVRYLVDFDLLTCGWDSDRPKVWVNGRPMKVRWVYAQKAGRLLRPPRAVAERLGGIPDPAARRAEIRGSDKPGVLVVDVAGTDHKLTCDLTSVFHDPVATPSDLDGTRARVLSRSRDGKPTATAEDYAALRKVREEQLAREWDGVLLDADLRTRMADPFDVLGVAPGREPRWATGRKPSDKMRRALINAGIARADVDRMSFHKARAALDVVFRRREAGLSTYGQVALLRRYEIDGLPLTFAEASAEIDRVKSARRAGIL